MILRRKQIRPALGKAARKPVQTIPATRNASPQIVSAPHRVDLHHPGTVTIAVPGSVTGMSLMHGRF